MQWNFQQDFFLKKKKKLKKNIEMQKFETRNKVYVIFENIPSKPWALH